MTYDSVEGVTSINFIKSLTLDGRELKVKKAVPGDNPNTFFTGQIEYSHILSMSCITDIPSQARFLGKVFDERLYQFGEHVVFIHNKSEFLKRIKKTISKVSTKYAWDNVEYLPAHYSGYMDVFKKVKEHHGIEYSYQQEWRFACLLGHDQRLEIQIGDLSDIAIYVPKEKIKNRIVINSDDTYSIYL